MYLPRRATLPWAGRPPRLGGNTFAFFTRNPRGGAQKPLDEADAAALRGFLCENGFGTLVAHAPYTLNACGKDEAVRDFAHRAMEEDIARLEAALARPVL